MAEGKGKWWKPVVWGMALIFVILVNKEHTKRYQDRITLLEDQLLSKEDRITLLEDQLLSKEDRITLLEDQLLSEEDMVAFIREKNPRVFPGLASLIVESIIKWSAEYRIPKEVVFSLMGVESTFDYTAVSEADAVGLMQIHLKTWVYTKNEKENLISLGIIDSKDDLYDPDTNIRAGTYILSKYRNDGKQKKHNNPIEYALIRYYGGTDNPHYKKTCRMLGDLFIFKIKSKTNI